MHDTYLIGHKQCQMNSQKITLKSYQLLSNLLPIEIITSSPYDFHLHLSTAI